MQEDRVKPDDNSRFRILTEISQQITSILDINELLVQVARLIQRTFQYYHVAIGLIENDEVIYRVGAGELWDDPHFQFKPQRLKVASEGISGWVAYTGEPVLAPDVSLDPHYVWMQGSLTRSELIVPITVKGKIIGVLDTQSQHLNDFRPGRHGIHADHFRDELPGPHGEVPGTGQSPPGEPAGTRHFFRKAMPWARPGP